MTYDDWKLAHPPEYYECPDGVDDDGEPLDELQRQLDRAERELVAANALLARAQDGRAKTPREANSDQIQLDYDIGRHLQRHGWHWDAINRVWRGQ